MKEAARRGDLLNCETGSVMMPPAVMMASAPSVVMTMPTPVTVAASDLDDHCIGTAQGIRDRVGANAKAQAANPINKSLLI
jgi:hypothetical protein